MTLFHGATFLGLLGVVVFLVYTTFKASTWPQKLVGSLWTLFVVSTAVWVLLIGYAKSECTDIGWDSGKWRIFENDIVCVERVERLFDKAEPKDPLRWRPYHE